MLYMPWLVALAIKIPSRSVSLALDSLLPSTCSKQSINCVSRSTIRNASHECCRWHLRLEEGIVQQEVSGHGQTPVSFPPFCV